MMVSCQLGKLKFHCARKTLFRVAFFGTFFSAYYWILPEILPLFKLCERSELVYIS